MDQPLTDLSHQRIGYARVSSVGQHLDSQLDTLQQAGCAEVFTDTMTGSRMDRPGWDRLLEYVRPGDTVVVTELSRMTRSLLDLLETSKLLEARHVELVSLRENIDTTSVAGRCFLSIMGAIHQLEGKCGQSGQQPVVPRQKPADAPAGDPARTSESWRTPAFCMSIPRRPPPKRAPSRAWADGPFSPTSPRTGAPPGRS